VILSSVFVLNRRNSAVFCGVAAPHAAAKGDVAAANEIVLVVIAAQPQSQPKQVFSA
jgi:hypothetical protein